MFEKIGEGLDGFSRNFQSPNGNGGNGKAGGSRGSLFEGFNDLLHMDSENSDTGGQGAASSGPASSGPASSGPASLALANTYNQDSSSSVQTSDGSTVKFSGFSEVEESNTLTDLLGPLLGDLTQAVQDNLAPHIEKLQDDVEAKTGELSDVNVDLALDVKLVQDEDGKYNLSINIDFKVTGLPEDAEVKDAVAEFLTKTEEAIQQTVDVFNENFEAFLGKFENDFKDILGSLPTVSVDVSWTVGDKQGQLGDGQIIDAIDDLIQNTLNAVDEVIDGVFDGLREFPIFKDGTESGESINDIEKTIDTLMDDLRGLFSNLFGGSKSS